MGAEAVYGVTGNPEKAEYAASFGYDRIFDYENLAARLADATGGRGVDVLLDSVGGPVRAAGFDLLAQFGRQVIFGDAAAEDATFTGVQIWGASKALAGFNLGALAHQRPEAVRGMLAEAVADVAAGDIRIDVTEVPLEEAAKAHEILESRLSRGKFVLRIGPA
ncbi:zinc-binding dehydrogenase [Microbispora sp. NBC_01389]|uniref:zinc-binding dehydrogenase n=1 Tax=Microbispora sp. NBC_01389 TaxID=2903584 RepID=UPI00324492AD